MQPIDARCRFCGAVMRDDYFVADEFGWLHYRCYKCYKVEKVQRRVA